ncbi:ERF family protein [Bradyrhizobium sp. JYMT SZCCT0428]|nr:ERF family protein [Bradyrhizobium sp. JYMT SZCCT0428]
MQRSSNKIGALATALSKAQSELANPEKTLTATLPGAVPGGPEKTFRYASLASGLELVRKCLGQHEIATVQATGIDRDTGLIRLTTTLVHASGEWMSSDWPVCPVGETASPHRMGAALTYARRYGLFTLVGIAGEDDLDAPDLSSSNDPILTNKSPPPNRGPDNMALGAYPAETSKRPLPAFARGRHAERPEAALLPAEATKVRDQLIAELARLEGLAQLTSWAQGALPRKNRISNLDALAVEAAFEKRLKEIGDVTVDAQVREPKPEWAPAEVDVAFARKNLGSKEVIVRSKPVRERDRGHLKYVAGQPCLACGRSPSDPHHIKYADSWTVGRKVSDRFTVPLCRLHHRELHRRGNERVWWQQKGIDPLPLADALWKTTHITDPASASLDGSGPPDGVNGNVYR